MTTPDINLFEYATRTVLRFASTRGLISVEQLWDVPLRSNDGFDLDAIARSLSQELKSVSEESFVEVAYGLSREYEYHLEGEIGHGQRTRRYASWLADRLRLPPKERDALE